VQRGENVTSEEEKKEAGVKKQCTGNEHGLHSWNSFGKAYILLKAYVKMKLFTLAR